MTRVYSVPAISCGRCKQTIETEVSKVVDVDTVVVDVAAKTVAVEGGASDEALRAAIDEAGYDVSGTSAT